MMDPLAEELEEIFMRHDYRWRISGEMKLPTAIDLRQTIDAAIKVLYAEKEPRVSLELGRLIIKRTGEIFDIYVHIEDTTKETQ